MNNILISNSQLNKFKFFWFNKLLIFLFACNLRITSVYYSNAHEFKGYLKMILMKIQAIFNHVLNTKSFLSSIMSCIYHHFLIYWRIFIKPMIYKQKISIDAVIFFRYFVWKFKENVAYVCRLFWWRMQESFKKFR